jgi:hypothetical protein
VKGTQNTVEFHILTGCVLNEMIISLMRKGPLTDAEGKALRKAASLRISWFGDFRRCHFACP